MATPPASGPAASAAPPSTSTGDADGASRRTLWIYTIRYGLGWALVIAGVALLIIDPGGFGVDGFAMATGSGLSVLLINFLYRLGVSGDADREREEEARRYLAEHGRWPDDTRRRP
jgi:hypothetical protein